MSPAVHPHPDAPQKLGAVSSALRVVVVDDNRDAADSLALILRAWGHDVATAYNGRAGFDLVVRTRPDAAFLDIGLPDLNGYEVAEGLMAVGAVPRLLVAVSGYGQPGDVARAKAAGFHHHFLKPAKLDDVARILAGAIDGRA